MPFTSIETDMTWGGAGIQSMTLVFSWIAVLGNGFVFLALSKNLHPNKKGWGGISISDVLVLNLASTDMLLGFSSVIAYPFYWNGVSQAVCGIHGLFIMLSCCESVLTLLLISLERYSSIVKRKQWTKSQTTKYLLISWTVSLCLAVLPLTPLGEMTAGSSGMSCRANWNAKGTRSVTGITCLIILTFVSNAIAYAYFGIFKHTKTILNAHVHDKNRASGSLLTAKLARKLGYLTLCFYLSWGLYTCIIIYEIFATRQVPPLLDSVSSYLAISNSAVNPVLYSILNRNYRLAMKRTLSCFSFKELGKTAIVHPTHPDASDASIRYTPSTKTHSRPSGGSSGMLSEHVSLTPLDTSQQHAQPLASV
jgi:hypothetical protein